MKHETLDRIIKMIENVVSRDQTRLALQHVEIKKNILQATDGHLLAQCFVEDNLGDTYIHIDQLDFLKSIKKQNKNNDEIKNVIIKNNSISIDGKKITNEMTSFPNIKNYIPSSEPVFEVGLNAEYLLSLVNALRSSKLPTCHLVFSSSDAAMTVYVDNKNVGVLMPVRIDKKIKEVKK